MPWLCYRKIPTLWSRLQSLLRQCIRNHKASSLSSLLTARKRAKTDPLSTLSLSLSPLTLSKSIQLSSSLFLPLSASLSIYLSIYLSVCLFICLQIYRGYPFHSSSYCDILSYFREETKLVCAGKVYIHLSSRRSQSLTYRPQKWA